MMQFFQNHKNRRLFALLICGLMAVTMLLPMNALAATDTGSFTRQVVRVGWYKSTGFQDGIGDNTEKSGFCYEYLQKVSNYTGWKYQYVYGEWSDLLQMLEDGEIDVLAGVSYTEEREAYMSFPDYSMGTDDYYLYQHESDGSMVASKMETFEGKKIGCVRNNRMTVFLEDWIEERGLNVQLVYYDGMTDRDEDFANGSLDGIVATENNILGSEDYAPVAKVGEEPYYLAVTRGRQDLLAHLNEALNSIQETEPYFLQNLTYNSYGSNLASDALTSMEKSWVESHDQLKVGYLIDYLPYCDTDEAGNPTGLMTEVVDEMLSKLKISDSVNAEYVEYKNYRQMISGLQSGEIDVAFPMGGGTWYLEQDGVCATSAVISSNVSMVCKDSYDVDAVQTIAVNENNRTQYYFTKTHFPDAECVSYSSIEECMKAVEKGEADATIIDGLRTDVVRGNSSYNRLNIIELNETDDRCFGVAYGNAGLLLLLNRGLKLIGANYAINASYGYLDDFYTYTWRDFFEDNLWGVLAIGLTVVLIILVMIGWHIHRLNQARKQLQMENETISSLSKLYFSIYRIDLENNLYEIVAVDQYDRTASRTGFAQQKLNNICESFAEGEERKKLKLFFDLSTLNERLAETESIELQYHASDDNWHEARFIVKNRDGEGRVTQVLYLTRVISTIKQEELRQKEALQAAYDLADNANRAKTLFLNHMSHDIRTPMNGIIGMTALAQAHVDEPDKLKDYLNHIASSSNYLLDLINQVLDVSRIESGSIKLEEKDFNLSEHIDAMVDLVRNQIESKQQNFQVLVENVTHEDVIGDPSRLQEVFVNLVSNAVKYTPEGGHITVRLEELESEVATFAKYQFTCKDDGYGMTPETVEKLFVPFERAKDERVQKTQGTGLGMVITKNIVHMMDGDIKVDSTFGLGTEFTVTLSLQKQNKDIEEFQNLKDLEVLLVDSDESERESARSTLMNMGVKVTSAGSVARALSLTEQHPNYGAYIVDSRVRGEDCVEIVKKLREQVGNKPPILISSGVDWTHFELEARAAGANDFISKPLFKSKLYAHLNMCLGSGTIEDTSDALDVFEEQDFSEKKILLAEDNDINREIAVEIIGMTGAKVECAVDGREALNMFEASEEGYYDLIFMDIQMPFMDGLHASRAIRNLSSSRGDAVTIPIVAMSANAFVEDMESSLRAGMNDHIAKPIDLEKLMNVMQKYLNQ